MSSHSYALGQALDSMPSRKRECVLTTRAVNRALIARQRLLRRDTSSALDAIEHLVGMQSQAPNPPYIGLWTRLEQFRHDDLSTLMLDRKAVRIALMRSTIHLVSADDCRRLRPLLQPVIERDFNSAYTKLLAGLDPSEVTTAGRELVEERPRTFSELGASLQARWPDRDRQALSQAVRTFVPLVQVPPRGLWGQSGQSLHTSAEAWLGQSLAQSPDPGELFLRYLAAFGPASVRDAQAWSGYTGLQAVADRLRPELVTFRDEQGRELFDLPEAPRPDPATPVPVRFLPEFDNILLSHADRTRIISAEHRARVFTNNGIIRGTVLIDGFVGATWKISRASGAATLTVDLFADTSESNREAIVDEGERLLRFAAEEATSTSVQFAPDA